MKDSILQALAEIQNGYTLCGVVDRRARIYPLGSDTKVVSALFEIVARQAVASYARDAGLTLVEPERRDHHPGSTLMQHDSDRAKTAIDVKSTYRKDAGSRFSPTMGGCIGSIHPGTGSRNDVFKGFSVHGPGRGRWGRSRPLAGCAASRPGSCREPAGAWRGP